MTVKELKEKLNSFDDNLEVWIGEYNIYYYNDCYNDWFCSPPFDTQSKCEGIISDHYRIILNGENVD